ncbi:hypothetical protein [Methylobacterium sp. SyP6R]|uniref:hypothetical protein n=1 Tax=Methylobacterium sp. SyP6R TaxID=2718876 RepID=UPI001F2B101F|nr:hypothetical protein [Methylobacterium sp. SyP6R]MCF4125065.1 hypothetical protein [Methylobacterium sp. SyP6R]
MTATARFEWPIRPDRIEVSSLGYLAAAILLADLRAARAAASRPAPAAPLPLATVHRLVPRRARMASAPSEGMRRAAEG